MNKKYILWNNKDMCFVCMGAISYQTMDINKATEMSLDDAKDFRYKGDTINLYIIPSPYCVAFFI